MQQITVFLYATLLLSQPCDASSLNSGIKGKRHLQDTTGGKAAEALFYKEGDRQENPEAESYDDVDRSTNYDTTNRNEDSVPSGLGGLEGYPVMEHNSEDATNKALVEGSESKKQAAKGKEIIENTEVPASPPSQAPKQSEVPTLEDVYANSVATPLPTGDEEATGTDFPDIDFVSFPTTSEADSPANQLFGGNLVEPATGLSDHMPQAKSIDTTTLEVPQEGSSQPGVSPHQASSQHLQPPLSREERSHGTAAIIMIGSGVGFLLMAISYLPDCRAKQRQFEAQKMELNFGGSQCETDMDTSAKPQHSAQELAVPYALSNDRYNNEGDAVYDPWAFQGPNNLDNETFLSDRNQRRQGRHSNSIDVYRWRMAQYVPRRTHTIYEESEDSSDAHSSVVDDIDWGQQVRTDHGTENTLEHLSRV